MQQRTGGDQRAGHKGHPGCCSPEACPAGNVLDLPLVGVRHDVESLKPA